MGVAQSGSVVCSVSGEICWRILSIENNDLLSFKFTTLLFLWLENDFYDFTISKKKSALKCGNLKIEEVESF